MKDRINNQLNMANTCFGIANSKDYVGVWTGNDPADFGVDLGLAQTKYAAILGKIALLEGTLGGGTDAKAAAETVLENAGYVLARALANHFKKTGDLVSRGKVNLAKRDLVRLSGQELVARATQIRDLGTTAATDPNAAKRGVTAARITAVTTAADSYTPVMNLPRGQIVNHSALLKEIETDTADLLVDMHDLDDLAVQFDGTDAGKRFIAAWVNARSIVDAGHGHTAAPTPTPAPASAATPAK